MTEQEFALRAQDQRGRLYRTAFLYLGGEHAAVDAVDEAVYQGFLHYKRLRQPEYFATWMTRILINACNAELRRRKRENAAQYPLVTACLAAADRLLDPARAMWEEPRCRRALARSGAQYPLRPGGQAHGRPCCGRELRRPWPRAAARP